MPPKTDPWLTTRMRHSTDIARAEALVLPAVTRAMSSYLTACRKAVLQGQSVAAAAENTGGQLPELDNWPPPSLWEQLVDRFVTPVLVKIFGAAFNELARDAVQDDRTWRAAYLDQVADRLHPSTWPAQVYTAVTSDVADGVQGGESIPEIAARVAASLDVNAWEGDARVIARTETMQALNGGSQAGASAWSLTSGEAMTKTWLATSDARTRHSHREADGQEVPIDQPYSVGGALLAFPGDPTGPPGEVIQCRCTSLFNYREAS